MIKKILITGCSQGLGHSLALQFAKKGCHVFAVGRHLEKLEALARQSSLIQAFSADIATTDGRRKIVETVAKDSISIIHNAAILDPMMFVDLSESLWRLHFETNFFAPLLITQQLLPVLKGQRVLHVSSGAANIPLPGLLTYCTTKASLEHATSCLNSELKEREIYFANLRPGMIDTNMQTNLRNTEKSKLPDRQFYIDSKQNNQLLSPDSVAKFVAKVVLETDNNVFCSTSWNVHDERYKEWLNF
jgi:benzil reductase ((S)-benzoin forming)